MKRKGIWWISPTLLEPVDGPWGRMRDFGDDAVLAWRAILDWAARLKVDTIVTGVEPFRTDRIVIQWPFHYVCHFPQDPLARCFDDSAIERHIRTVRQITADARERGIRIMLHHYNFMAPERWVEGHAELSRKVDAIEDPAWGRRFHTDRLGFLLANICWNDADYRAFMGRCWRELFSNVPDLAGLMITSGEFTHCHCDACTGGVATDHFGQLLKGTPADQAARVGMIRDFILTCKDMMKELGKDLIARTWCLESWRDDLPRDMDFAIKYAVFDACWGEPDPVALAWCGEGRRMWMSEAIEAENSGPIVWHDERWCTEVAGKLNKIDSIGTLVHLNAYWGHNGLSTFTASRNIQRMLEHLEPAATPGYSAEEFTKFFGSEHGPEVYEAARLFASVPLQMTSIIHLKGEGFTYGHHYWFNGEQRWPGVLGTEVMDAPAWANPNKIVTLGELMAQVKGDPDCLDELLDRPNHSVISRLDELSALAQKGLDTLEPIAKENSLTMGCDARAEIRILIASGQMAFYLAREFSGVLRARLAWHVVENLDATDPRSARARRRTIELYRVGVEALRAQLGWALEFSERQLDFIWLVAEARETFSKYPIATRLEYREQELESLEATF